MHFCHLLGCFCPHTWTPPRGPNSETHPIPLQVWMPSLPHNTCCWAPVLAFLFPTSGSCFLVEVGPCPCRTVGATQLLSVLPVLLFLCCPNQSALLLETESGWTTTALWRAQWSSPDRAPISLVSSEQVAIWFLAFRLLKSQPASWWTAPKFRSTSHLLVSEWYNPGPQETKPQRSVCPGRVFQMHWF